MENPQLIIFTRLVIGIYHKTTVLFKPRDIKLMTISFTCSIGLVFLFYNLLLLFFFLFLSYALSIRHPLTISFMDDTVAIVAQRILIKIALS